MSLRPPIHTDPEVRSVVAEPVAPPGGLTMAERAARLARASVPDARGRPATWPRVLLLGFVVAATVGIAAAWTLVARRELERARVADLAGDLDRARVTFDAARARSLAGLQAVCRLLAEDPRLKATLATADIDAATVDDILDDLGALRGGGFFMVLSPDARVFAEAGAEALRGLDLSGSSLVQRAAREPGAVQGAWTLGGTVTDLAVTAIRYGDHLVAYLVVGQALDGAELASLARQCDCEVASALGDTIAASSTAAAAGQGGAVVARMAAEPGAWRGRVLAAGGAPHVTTAIELGDVSQSHRLLLARALGDGGAALVRLRSLFWLPPALVLVSVLFTILAGRVPRRSS